MRTVGQIGYNVKGRCWCITCEPHVAMRLKRVFGKLSRASHGTHLVSDSIENARDLDWFLTRYPMMITSGDLARLNGRVAEHRERESLVDGLLSRRVAPPPFDLAVPAREYQKIAAALALQTKGLLLADDVGIGKTASSICMLTDPRTLPALVVTLTHLPRQWQEEIKKFAPSLKTHIIKKGQPYDVTSNGRLSRQLRLPEAFPDVLIINYHKLSGWAETLAPLVRTIIFDECQELRRTESQKYKSAKYIANSAEWRIGLSATPIYNYGGEFFSVLDVLRPGALGVPHEFFQEWCNGWGDKASIQSPKAFGSYLRESGIMLRRTRAEVGRELPPLTKIPHHIDADPAALDRVSSSCAELARLILSQGEAFKGQKLQASEELSNKLRQATGIAKAPFVASFVRLLIESGEKVVLYGWHRDVYTIWNDALADLKPVMFTGSESPTQKEQSRQAFIKGQTPILMMSLRAGAGLDGLQGHCRTVVFGELDWSPGVHEQAIGRVHRDGQGDPVVAYFLMADSGADPIIADVLGLKRQQIEGVRDVNAALVEKLEGDRDHIKRLAAGYLAQVQPERLQATG